MPSIPLPWTVTGPLGTNKYTMTISFITKTISFITMTISFMLRTLKDHNTWPLIVYLTNYFIDPNDAIKK